MRGIWRSAAAAEASVRAAYAAHADELYRFAARRLGDTALAEEAVQEVFVRAWRATRARGRPSSAPGRPSPASGRAAVSPIERRTWLLAIAASVVLETAWGRSARLQEELRAAGDPVGQVVRSWQVEEALRQVSSDHRHAIVETCHRGRPTGEVAAGLGIPEEALRSRVYYGLRALRLALEEKGWAECAAN